MLSLLGKICDSLGISFNFLNRENSPSNKLSVRDASVGSVQQAGRDIHNTIVAPGARSQDRPQIDTDQWGGTGGPDGVSIEFYAKNIGNVAAMDIQAELVAEDLQGNVQLGSVANSLTSNQSSRLITYRYDSTDFFKRALKNPCIVFKYKSADGRELMSGRTIVQESRAAGGFNIHTKSPTAYFSQEIKEEIVVEVDRADFNMHRRSDGLAESFTVMIQVLIKNRSQETILVRNVRPTLGVPTGYQNGPYHNSFDYPDGKNINGREVFPCKFGFTVTIEGEQRDRPLHEIPEWIANKKKLLSSINSAKVIFRFRAESVTPEGIKTIDKEFDLTRSLLPQIFTSPTSPPPP